jgi:6-phosphofructokinase 2
MSRIVAFTLNPAVDEGTAVERVVADRKLRCDAPRSWPGGGGVNVARAIHRLGGDTLAIFPAGGASGDLLEELLQAEGVPGDRVSIAGSTRRNWNVGERSTGREFRFCVPGPTLSEKEWGLCLDRIRQASRGASYVVGSGSLPPGAPVDFYARAAAVAAGAGARFVLDTAGAPLRSALARGVHLVKPSLSEFRELTGGADGTPLEVAGERMIAEGMCHALVVSLGPAGAFWMDAAARDRVGAPVVALSSSVGAGDCLVAGIVLALDRGRSLADAVAFGVAVASASVSNPGTELCRPEDVERLSGVMPLRPRS